MSIEAGKAIVKIFGDKSPLVRELRGAQADMQKFGEGIANTGKKIAGMGAAIMAPLMAGAAAFGEFEKQMKMVSTMLSDTSYMDGYTSSIRSLATTYGEGTDVLAKGLYDLLSASVAPTKAIGVLEVAVKAAKGGMTDTAVAVDGLTSVLNAFGMQADQAGHVSDVMFQTVKRGKITFPDLAANIGKVAPMARAAGMSMEDMMAAIATMTRQGLTAEETATRLVNILKQAPAEAANLAGLVQRYAGKSLEEIQVDFPEIRAAGGIAALAADMQGFRQDLELMQNATGQAEEAFKKMTGSLLGSAGKVKAALLDIGVSVGEAIAPALKDFNAYLQANLKHVKAWVADNKELIVTALKIGATLVVTGTALAAFGTVFTGLAGVVKTLTGVIGSLQVAMSFFVAHPAVAVIAGLTAGAIALNYALNQASAVTWELTNAQKGLADAADKTRAGDLAQVDRLAALANQQSMTSAELKEAQGIVEALQSRYGDLGVSVDAATGKIIGMAGAQERLNGAMKKQVADEIDAQLVEHSANLELLQRKIQEINKSGGGSTFEIGGYEIGANPLNWFGSTAGQRNEELKKAMEDFNKIEAAIAGLRQRRKNLQKGDKGALTGEGGEPAAAPAAPKPPVGPRPGVLTKEDQEKKADYERSLAEKVTAAQIALIKDKHDQELANITEKWRKEREEAKKAHADQAALDKIDQAEALEKRKAQEDHAKAVADANRENRQEHAGTRLDVEAQQIQTRINSLKARGSEDKNTARQIAALELELDERRLANQLENIEAERKAAIEAAQESGANVDIINEKYRAQADLARASFQAGRTAMAASIQYKGPAQALVRGSAEEYNASIGIKQPMDELVAEAKAQAARQEEANKTLKEIAAKAPKVVSAPR